MANKKRKRMNNKASRDVKTGLKNIDKNSLIEIISRVPKFEVFFGVLWVSQALQSACCEHLFLKGDALDFTGLDWSVMHTTSSRRFTMDILKVIMNWFVKFNNTNFRKIHTIIFPPWVDLRDWHLIYIAQRSCSLKSVVIPCASHITGKGFSRAIRNWKDLIEISIGPLLWRHHTHILQEIGINCKKLEKLVICGDLAHSNGSPDVFDLDEYACSLIVQHLPKLKILGLESSQYSAFALKVLTLKHKNLQEIRLYKCKEAISVNWHVNLVRVSEETSQVIYTGSNLSRQTKHPS